MLNFYFSERNSLRLFTLTIGVGVEVLLLVFRERSTFYLSDRSCRILIFRREKAVDTLLFDYFRTEEAVHFLFFDYFRTEEAVHFLFFDYFRTEEAVDFLFFDFSDRRSRRFSIFRLFSDRRSRRLYIFSDTRRPSIFTSQRFLSSERTNVILTSFYLFSYLHQVDYN
jgi:hypothetical protein